MCYFHCCSPEYYAVVMCFVIMSGCKYVSPVVIRHPLPKLSLFLLCRDLNDSGFVNNTSRPKKMINHSRFDV